jgi:hypothetical protein
MGLASFTILSAKAQWANSFGQEKRELDIPHPGWRIIEGHAVRNE